MGALSSDAGPLFNGNIAAMAVNIPRLGSATVYNYHYDQLNRIVAMDQVNGLHTPTGTFTPSPSTAYQERISYDANGNILTYRRNGDSSRLSMDELSYFYKQGTNQLQKVTDAAQDATDSTYSRYNDLRQGQADNNYRYDAIGNLTSDAKDSITSIQWNVYGKISSITKNASVIRYIYDASGNRILKYTSTDATAYVRDASGNVLSVYTATAGPDSTVVQLETHLYGSSRLGMATRHQAADSTIELAPGFGKAQLRIFTSGEKLFELSNHLGNVLATVSDRKIALDTTGDGFTDNYIPDVISAQDYYPGGMLLPGRKFSNGNGYRYGFANKEMDNEIKGYGNSYDFGDRVFDSRIVRWWSVDPLRQIYSSLSPYSYSANNFLNIVDADGNILKDKQGNIIATADARVDENKNSRTIKYPDGSSLKINYKYVIIYTDEGNPVTAKIVTKAVVRMKGKDGKITEKPATNFKNLDVSSNCHGYAFAEGKVIIDDGESMQKIIKEDAYKYLGNASPNSKEADIIVIYSPNASTTEEELSQGKIDADDWHHTAKKEKGKATYTDKDDVYPRRANLNPVDVEQYDDDKGDQTVLFYKKETGKGGRKVDVKEGTVVNGVRTVDKKEAEKITKKLKTTLSN